MQHYLRGEKQQRGYFVCDALGKVEMSRIQSYDLAFFRTVPQIKVVRADSVAFEAYAEQFGLDAVFHVVVFLFKNFV